MMTIDPAIYAGELDFSTVQLPDITAGEVGAVLLSLGVTALVYQGIRGWVKRKGFRMILRDRNDKKHALLLNILTDGIEDAVVAGKISNKEADDMYRELQRKMGLNDLVPKKRLQRMVKEDIKRARAKRGLSPVPVVKKAFSERLGNAAKFWQKPAA